MKTAGVLLLTVLLLSTNLLQAGGGLSFDGINDWLDCTPIAFDISRATASTVVFVRPNFGPTDTADRYIWSNLVGTSGALLLWQGATSQRFFFGEADPASPFGGTSITCGAAAFNAGDLLGIAGWLSNGVQQCEIYNFTQFPLGGSTASSFFGFAQSVNSAANLAIGSLPDGTLKWDGEIYLIEISNKRVLNSNSNWLPPRRKIVYYPMLPSDAIVSSPGGYVDYVAAYYFYQGAMGGTFTGLTLQDVSGNGANCTVGGGAPTVVGSPMLY